MEVFHKTMPKVTVAVLTHNRAELLRRALASIFSQTFRDVEVLVINDASEDETGEVLSDFQSMHTNLRVVFHDRPAGITLSRQEVLEAAQGDYVAFLDDDDEWVDAHKLAKQVKFLEEHPDYVLIGGGIKIASGSRNTELRRSKTDRSIRKWMLFKNCFFTSTVMLRRSVALECAGFVSDGVDLAEDYDLWLRMGKQGKLYNFQDIFTLYTKPSYSKEKFKAFLDKQIILISKHKADYPGYYLARFILELRKLS